MYHKSTKCISTVCAMCGKINGTAAVAVRCGFGRAPPGRSAASAPGDDGPLSDRFGQVCSGTLTSFFRYLVYLKLSFSSLSFLQKRSTDR